MVIQQEMSPAVPDQDTVGRYRCTGKLPVMCQKVQGSGKLTGR